MPEAIDVFISHALQDAEYLAALKEHLAPLRREGRIAVWDAHDLRPGEERAEIAEHLERADMVLFLVSASFLESDARHRQVQKALARRRSDGLQVVPIIVRPVDWESSALGELQALPAGGRPITRWDDADAAWVDVARSLRRRLVRRPRRGARPRPAVLPEAVPYRVDRDPQLRAVRDALREAQKTTPPRPVVAVAWGREHRGQDALAERLRGEGLRQLLRLPETRKLHDHLLRWPRYWRRLSDGLLERLGEEVVGDDRAGAARIDDTWGKDPVLISTLLDSGDWRRDGARAVQAFTELWRGWPELGAGQALVALLTLELDDTALYGVFGRWIRHLGRHRDGLPEIVARLEAALAGDDRIIGVVLPRLRAVEHGDARDWARRTARDYGWPVDRLLRPVDAVYSEQDGGALPIDDLIDELRRILDRALFPKEALT